MYQLTLEWVEAGQVKTRTFNNQQFSKNPGTFRIGRDPTKCDLVMQHPTVSKLHVEVFFMPEKKEFYLRNLRETNPPLVDRQRLVQGEAPLEQGTIVLLGDLEIRVKSVEVSADIPPTFVAAHLASYQRLGAPQPIAPQAIAIHQANLSYGLECPKCHHVSSYDHLEVGCAWCGTSLAAAQSVLLIPESSSQS
jgi:predicted component of type VI protein secretion system